MLIETTDTTLTLHCTKTARTNRLSDGSIVRQGQVWLTSGPKGGGNTLVDTDAIDVYPLADKTRLLLEASPKMAHALLSVLTYVTGGADEDDIKAIEEACRDALGVAFGCDPDAVTSRDIESIKASEGNDDDDELENPVDLVVVLNGTQQVNIERIKAVATLVKPFGQDNIDYGVHTVAGDTNLSFSVEADHAQVVAGQLKPLSGVRRVIIDGASV